ncbi:hypothetical protein [Cytobacillus kochii]|uniref:hypothetical protein n=1 Tax=Cytobacillus kochii TaxID=859143 RepID=UPI001CD3A74D|nr:hypothetical protein [Cytobacillus kochii]MCA1028842.1 hypothetical protein [Cytobacillus kochii]
MADITVKGLSSSTNNKLTEKAKKAGCSKNKYIITLLEKHVVSEEVEGVREDYEELVKSMLQVVEKNTVVMKELVKAYQED